MSNYSQKPDQSAPLWCSSSRGHFRNPARIVTYVKLRDAAINGMFGTRTHRDASNSVNAAFWEGFDGRRSPTKKDSDEYVAYVLGTKVRRQDEKDAQIRANLKVVEGQFVSQAQYAIWAAMPQGKWIDAAKLSSEMKEYNRTTTGRIMQELYEKGILQRKHDVPPYYRRKER